MVDGMVICQIEVSKAMLVQGIKPFRLSTEDKLFEYRSLDFRGRTFEIAYDDLSLTEHGVNAIRKEMVDSVTVDGLTYTTIKKDVASENDGECICILRGYTQHHTNSQNYRKTPH